MRRHQTKIPASTKTQNVDESPFSVPGTCRKPIITKQENAHYTSERYHYSVIMFFLPASFGTL